MKKIILTLILVSFLLFPIISIAAINVGPNMQNLLGILDRIANYLLVGLVAISVIFVIVAGYLMVSAQGDPEKVKTARQLIIYVLIGVAVGVLAKVLVGVASELLGIDVINL